jgi:hypothetical protein
MSTQKTETYRHIYIEKFIRVSAFIMLIITKVYSRLIIHHNCELLRTVYGALYNLQSLYYTAA